MEKIKDINRLNDVFFKSLLGDEKRKNLTIDFLNAILNKDETNYFVDIEFIDKELTPIIEGGKVSILDIRAKMNDKTQINIEVQIVKQDYINKRSLYYWSKIYSEQLKKGQEYELLNPTITINLMNFKYFAQYDTFYNAYHIRNDKTGDILTDDLEMHFIELPKFKISDIKKLRKDEKWIAYFSHNCTDEQREEIAMSEPAIKQALQYEDYFTQDEKLRRLYDIQEKATRDYISSMSSVRRDERRKAKREDVINGLKEGFSVDTIFRITKVSIKEIEDIKKELNL